MLECPVRQLKALVGHKLTDLWALVYSPCMSAHQPVSAMIGTKERTKTMKATKVKGTIIGDKAAVNDMEQGQLAAMLKRCGYGGVILVLSGFAGADADNENEELELDGDEMRALADLSQELATIADTYCPSRDDLED